MRIEPWLPPKLGVPRRLDLQVGLPLARKVFGHTQTDLARHLHVSDWTVGRWERGERYPYKRTEFLLTRYFIKANRILAGEGELTRRQARQR